MNIHTLFSWSYYTKWNKVDFRYLNLYHRKLNNFIYNCWSFLCYVLYINTYCVKDTTLWNNLLTWGLNLISYEHGSYSVKAFKSKTRLKMLSNDIMLYIFLLCIIYFHNIVNSIFDQPCFNIYCMYYFYHLFMLLSNKTVWILWLKV